MQRQIHGTFIFGVISAGILAHVAAAPPPDGPRSTDRSEAASADHRQQGRMR